MEPQASREMMQYTLVSRKPNFGLPTACPVCLPVYIYLKLAGFPFAVDVNTNYPDSDEIPYVDSGTYAAFNNETGGVISRLKDDGIVDLDAEISSISEWVSLKAMITSYLEETFTYELWIGSGGNCAWKIYYSDLPWIIGKVLHMKKVYSVKQRFGISKENADRLEEEMYQKAKGAYGALSSKIGEDTFLFENRPSSLDAHLLAHLLLTLEALPESSVLRSSLLEFSNLVRYAEKHRAQLLTGDSPSSLPPPPRSPWQSDSKPRKKDKREKTEEEKAFRKKAKYFLVTQIVAVLLFLSITGGYGPSDVEAADEDGSYYD